MQVIATEAVTFVASWLPLHRIRTCSSYPGLNRRQCQACLTVVPWRPPKPKPSVPAVGKGPTQKPKTVHRGPKLFLANWTAAGRGAKDGPQRIPDAQDTHKNLMANLQSPKFHYSP